MLFSVVVGGCEYHHKLRHRIICMKTIRHMEKND